MGFGDRELPVRGFSGQQHPLVLWCLGRDRLPIRISVRWRYVETRKRECVNAYTWVVVKIMVPFWVPNIVRHLIFGVPKKGP